MCTYLIGSVPKMEINGALPFFLSPSPPPQVILRSTQFSAENPNEEGREGAATAGLIQNSLLQTGPPTPTQWEGKLHGPPCDTVSTSQFGKVPASDATRNPCNRDAGRRLFWFWCLQVAVGFGQNLNIENKNN